MGHFIFFWSQALPQGHRVHVSLKHDHTFFHSVVSLESPLRQFETNAECGQRTQGQGTLRSSGIAVDQQQLPNCGEKTLKRS